jgi:hypothetical protein
MNVVQASSLLSSFSGYGACLPQEVQHRREALET